MAKYCRYCGESVEWKNNAGYYRKFCEDCADRVAAGEDLQKRYDPDTGEKL